MSPVFGHGRLRLYLLKLLDEAPRHGYEVIRLLQDRFMGVYAPSPGTIYPRLARLEEEGFLTHDEEDGRKIYRITDKGRAEINRHLDELDELEREITESVSGIAREVKEDVRETVRSLREELTWATREMRGEGGRPAHERARQARAEARAHAQRVREEMRQASGQTAGGAPQRETPGRGQQEDTEARAGGECGDRPGWQDRDWAPWIDWPGRRRRSDRGRGGAGRDFETLARELGNEVRSIIGQAGALGEGAMDELRHILEDALARIRTEVFGPVKPAPQEPESAGESGPGEPGADGGPAGQEKGSGKPGEAAADQRPPEAAGETGDPGSREEPGHGGGHSQPEGSG